MDERLQAQFEKSAQEYYKELWEYIWGNVGTVVLLFLVGFGIYFSKVALNKWFGTGDLEEVFAWAVSIGISAIEVAGIKLLGNKIRSKMILENNKLEHKTVTIFSYCLYVFDFCTNFYGLWITATAVALLDKREMNFLSIGTVFIIGLSALMTFSEILVGWMLRHVATGYVGYFSAKVKYDMYKEKVEKESVRDAEKQIGESNKGHDDNKQYYDPREQKPSEDRNRHPMPPNMSGDGRHQNDGRGRDGQRQMPMPINARPPQGGQERR